MITLTSIKPITAITLTITMIMTIKAIKIVMMKT